MKLGDPHALLCLMVCRGGLVPKLLMGAVLVAGGVFAAKMIQEHANKDEKAEDDKGKQKK